MSNLNILFFVIASVALVISGILSSFVFSFFKDYLKNQKGNEKDIAALFTRTNNLRDDYDRALLNIYQLETALTVTHLLSKVEKGYYILPKHIFSCPSNIKCLWEIQQDGRVNHYNQYINMATIECLKFIIHSNNIKCYSEEELKDYKHKTNTTLISIDSFAINVLAGL